MSISILIADDQALVRAGFKMILETDPGLRVVAEAHDGAQAVEATRRTRPDIVLMDIRMPGMDGLEATRRIIAAKDPPRVLMLTTFDRDEYVFDALVAGASGFLLKDVAPEQLLAGIRIIVQGDSLLSPSVTRRLIESFIRDHQPTPQPPPGLDQLTPRELRSSGSSHAVCPTPRSPTSSSCRAPRSRRTSPGCSSSSGSATASKQSYSPTKPASSAPAPRADTNQYRTGKYGRPSPLAGLADQPSGIGMEHILMTAGTAHELRMVTCPALGGWQDGPFDPLNRHRGWGDSRESPR